MADQRMTEELKEIGLNVGHRCVGRLMRQNGILNRPGFTGEFVDQ